MLFKNKIKNMTKYKPLIEKNKILTNIYHPSIII